LGEAKDEAYWILWLSEHDTDQMVGEVVDLGDEIRGAPQAGWSDDRIAKAGRRQAALIHDLLEWYRRGRALGGDGPAGERHRRVELRARSRRHGWHGSPVEQLRVGKLSAKKPLTITVGCFFLGEGAGQG
jgi:hypothetical protein